MVFRWTRYLLVAVIPFALTSGLAAQTADNGADPKLSPEQQVERLTERVWWNQTDMIEALGLKVEQRQRMDARFKSFLSDRVESRGAQRDRSADFYAQLEAKDFDGARQALDELEASTVQQIRAQPEMKIDVLGMLTQQQLDKLGESYDHLFKQPWVRRMGLGGDRRPANPAMRERSRTRQQGGGNGGL